jgi:hypothetical protein
MAFLGEAGKASGAARARIPYAASASAVPSPPATPAQNPRSKGPVDAESADRANRRGDGKPHENGLGEEKDRHGS